MASKYGPVPDDKCLSELSKRCHTLTRTSRPPTFDSVLEWCDRMNISVEDEPLDDSSSENGDEFNKTCIRVRQNSEDSFGSEITLSPPTSPIEPDDVEAINKSIVRNIS